MTPPVVMVLPVYLIFTSLDLMDTPLAIALAHCLFNVPISIWVLESFRSAIPKELDETAFIDGYSFFQFFTRRLIPLMAMTVLSIIPGALMIYFVRNHIAKGFTIKKVS